MRSRRTAPIILLVLTAGCIIYVALRAGVRGGSERPLKQAALLLQQDEPVRARAALRWLLWFEPDHPGALHLTALSYLQEQDFAAAIERLERIDEGSPVHHDARLDLSTALLADRQFDRAEIVLKDILSRYPDALLARRQLSGIFLTERRQREAVQLLEEYLDLTIADPPGPTEQLLVLRDLATAEFHPPPAENCLPALEEALELHPQQTGVRVAIAQCYLDLGHVNRANQVLEHELAERPEDTRIRLIECAILLESGELDSAESLLSDDLRASAPEQEDVFWELRCRIAESRGDHEQALTDIDRAIALVPGDPDLESRRARLLQRIGRADDARHAYARSHELAKWELELWDLSREIGVRNPTTAECEQMARNYESLGKSRQAAAWRRLAGELEREPVPQEQPPL